MAFSITIQKIDRRADRTYIRLASGNEIEISGGTLADLRAWIQAQFSEREEALLGLALAAYIARDPNVTNPGQIVGRTVTLDLAAGKVTYPDAVLRVS